MRLLSIDLSTDTNLVQKLFGGYEGEHNETRLEVKLPSRLLSNDATAYKFTFETASLLVRIKEKTKRRSI